jgi:hypothetical protein
MRGAQHSTGDQYHARLALLTHILSAEVNTPLPAPSTWRDEAFTSTSKMAAVCGAQNGGLSVRAPQRVHLCGSRGAQYTRMTASSVRRAGGRRRALSVARTHVHVDVIGKRNSRPLVETTEMKSSAPSRLGDASPMNHASAPRPRHAHRLKRYHPARTVGFVEMPRGALAAIFTIASDLAFRFVGAAGGAIGGAVATRARES